MKRQIEADAAKAAVVPAMARDIKAMRQLYSKDWDRRLPQQKEQAEFLREISASLSQAKLFNQMIRLGQPTHGRLYNRLPITMEFEGEFLALARFLKQVDGMTRLTRIEELKIQPIHGSDDLSIKLGMNIYFTEQWDDQQHGEDALQLD